MALNSTKKRQKNSGNSKYGVLTSKKKKPWFTHPPHPHPTFCISQLYSYFYLAFLLLPLSLSFTKSGTVILIVAYCSSCNERGVMAAATDGETTNPNGEVEPPVRRSLGRRKSCKGSEASSPSSMAKKKKKKVPQRGMGIDKLESQRIQEEWKKMKEITHQPFITLNPINISPNLHYLGFPNSDLHFGINNHLAGFSKELSSTPNSVNCNSHHCNACHKVRTRVSLSSLSLSS